MVAQGADGDIPDGVDLPKQLRIHAEHSPPVGKEEYLSLGGAGIVRPLYGSHSRHTQGSFFFVNFPGVLFPDKNGFLADVKKLRDVFFRNDMPAFECGSFKSVTHGSNIMTKLHADGRFNRYFFHFLSSPISFRILRNQNHILRNRIRSYYNRIAFQKPLFF